MPLTYEIRANYNQNTIIVYQAYRKEIALPALEQQRFVPPFSLNRMTWIKPSFLWMMERSNWGLKPGQEYILAVTIKRQGWEEALAKGVLTSPEQGVFHRYDDWKAQFEKAQVHIQWDPERSIQGKSLQYFSIQVGLSRHIIEQYVNDWVVKIEDYSNLARKIYRLINSGQLAKAREFLPKERIYPVTPSTGRRLGLS